MKRTALKRGNKPIPKKRKDKDEFIEKHLSRIKMLSVFYRIWYERPHICQSCSKPLGDEPRTIFFDHLLEKSVFPELTLEKWNILLVCEECHDLKSRGFPTLNHGGEIEKAQEFFENEYKTPNLESKS